MSMSEKIYRQYADEILQLKGQLSAEKRRNESLRSQLVELQQRSAAQETGWHVIGDDGEWNKFGTEREADSHAEGCAAQGIASTVVLVTKQYPAELVENWGAYNGVTAGVDFPNTLNQPRAA